MENSEKKRFHQKAYRHVKKHRKKYSRFFLFFIILLIFRVMEDYFLLKTIGLEFEIDLFILLSMISAAFIFTVVSEITEKMIEEEEAKKLLEFIRKKEPKIEKVIKKEEEMIKKKMKK